VLVVDSDLADYVATFLVDWVCAGVERPLVRTLSSLLVGYGLPEETDGDGLYGLLREAAERDRVEVLIEGETSYRRVSLHLSSGVADLAVGWLTDDVADFPAALSELIDTLARMAPWLEYGRIMRVRGSQVAPSGGTAYDSGHRPPPAWQNDARPNLRVVTKRGSIPDAFGIQLLGPHILARTDLSLDRLPDWSATAFGDRLFLLHDSLDAWYANATPERTVLEKARRDLENLFPAPWTG
jgi:hypothetical protein